MTLPTPAVFWRVGHCRMVTTLATDVGGKGAVAIHGFRCRNHIHSHEAIRSKLTFTLLQMHGNLSPSFFHTKTTGQFCRIGTANDIRYVMRKTNFLWNASHDENSEKSRNDAGLLYVNLSWRIGTMTRYEIRNYIRETYRRKLWYEAIPSSSAWYLDNNIMFDININIRHEHSSE